MIGVTLGGRYIIQELIGSGGMAVVYKALDTRTNRIVAVKLLREEFNRDQAFLRRFDREAMACAKVQHTNIVNLLNIGEEGETRFLVMEYVSGSTLKDLIREQGRIPQREAVRITKQALSALAHAHDKHIIHRDIKPQNILVDMNGNVKIADFGIARMTDSNTKTMNDGNVMGSVHYFSPEQAKGQEVGAPSDLYSMGVVLYEMLSGHVPFDGDTSVAVALQHVNDLPKPISALVPDVTPALEQVLTKAMCKNLAQRYETAEQMNSDLRRALVQPEGGFVKMRPAAVTTDATQPPPPPAERDRAKARRRMRGRLLFALTLIIGAAVLAVIGVAGYQFWQRMTRYVSVPNVVGLEESLATDALRRANLEYIGLTKHSDTVLKGFVISQEPGEGYELERGDQVVVYVSVGSGQVAVPSLVGLPLEEAERQLREHGMMSGDVVEVLSELPLGLVVAQMPEAGEEAVDGTPVDLHISGGMVVMADLAGQQLTQATARIQELGLTLGTVTYVDIDDPRQDMLIQSQNPKLSEQLFPGTPVDLSVGRVERRPFSKEISVRVNIPEGGAHIRITLVQSNGSEVEQYAARHALHGETNLTVQLRSAISGELSYRLYVDQTLVTEEPVVFE